jgi:opacity protein-like surface antigen
MENKRINNIMNKNWNAMESILDKEMPIQNKKRRILWIWMFVFGIISCSSAFYISNQNTDNNVKSKQEEKLPSSESTNTQIASNTNENSNLNMESSANDSPTQRKGRRDKILSNSKVTNFTKQSTHKQENLFVKREPDVIKVSKIQESPSIMTQHETEDFEKEESRIILPEIYDVDQLNTIAINSLNYHHSLPNMVVKNNENRSTFKLGVITGVATTSFNAISSTYLGVQIEKGLNKSFSFYSNLGWRQYKGTNTNILLNNSSVISLESATNSTNLDLDMDLGELIINDITKSLNYAEVSGGIKYQIKNKLKVMGAFNLGYLISESYKIDEETQALYQDQTGVKDLNQFLREAEQSTQHQKLTYHLNLGLEYKLIRNFYLYGNVHHYLTSNNNNFQQNYSNKNSRQWFELGLKYNFIK